MTSRPLLATACLTVVAAIITGCGAEVPSNSVAKVGGDNITKEEFNKWLKTAAMGQSQGGPAVVPDPPNFTQCVAQRQQQPVQKGQPKPSAAQLKTQCKQEFDRLKGEVMQFLIQAQWVQQEAEQRDVEVSDAEVKKSFDDQKKQAFPSAKEYQQFLKTSGMNEQDILFRVRLDTLQNKLTKKITEDETKVTDQDVQNYYNKNKKRFSQPERRDLLVVLTKTKAQADKAKKALEDGDKFAAVAKKYSVDNASKAQGGKLPDVTKGSQEKAFEEAVFKAEKGKVEGPVKTQFGYYVFQVTAIKKPSQQSLDQAKDSIKQLLKSQRQQKALDGFIKKFREDYKEKTACAKDYVVQECKNAPKQQNTGQQGAPQQGVPQGSQAAPPGGAPQQVPQQGAPAAGAPGSTAAGPTGQRRPAGADAHAAADRSGSVGPRLAIAETEDAQRAAAGAAALARLDEITRRLRRDCPWDREQDERSIVPHTVEEAYELADAAHSGDDAKLIDELGDVLFQVHFLALLAEERGAGDLAAVADACREKLIRRHPHVFGSERAESADAVLRNWGRIKREDERGGEVFGDLPDNLPAPLYARKVVKRAASAGLYEVPEGGGATFEEHGEALMAAVEAAHADGVDPELALRAAADRFRADRQAAE